MIILVSSKQPSSSINEHLEEESINALSQGLIWTTMLNQVLYLVPNPVLNQSLFLVLSQALLPVPDQASSPATVPSSLPTLLELVN